MKEDLLSDGNDSVEVIEVRKIVSPSKGFPVIREGRKLAPHPSILHFPELLERENQLNELWTLIDELLVEINEVRPYLLNVHARLDELRGEIKLSEQKLGKKGSEHNGILEHIFEAEPFSKSDGRIPQYRMRAKLMKCNQQIDDLLALENELAYRIAKLPLQPKDLLPSRNWDDDYSDDDYDRLFDWWSSGLPRLEELTDKQKLVIADYHVTLRMELLGLH